MQIVDSTLDMYRVRLAGGLDAPMQLGHSTFDTYRMRLPRGFLVHPCSWEDSRDVSRLRS